MSSNEDMELVYEFMTIKVYKINLDEDYYFYLTTPSRTTVVRTLKEAVTLAHKIGEGKFTFESCWD